MTLYDKYIDIVTTGKENAGQLEILGVQRHLNDLERAKSDDYPYYFDRASADQMINFVKSCKLSGDTFQGTPFPVQPFQAFYYAMVYGWKRKEDNLRRFRRVYWSTARKSAKSEMTAPECLFHLLTYPGKTQICIVATTFNQAKYIYEPCVYMAGQLKSDFEDVGELLKVTQYQIKNTKTMGYITRFTADHKTNDGAGIQFGSVDEYHAYDDDTMVGVVASSQGTVKEPILKIVTTAGFNKNGPDYALRKKCINILNGVIEDERQFCMIYSLDEVDDWTDVKNWRKPNPMIGITPTYDFLEDECKKAIDESGETMVNFLTKNMNVYTDASKIWIEAEKYKACAGYIEPEQLRGLKCVAGFDLASEHDTTAITYLFFPQEGFNKFYYMTRYYCPAGKFKKVRVDGVFYETWHPEWIDKTDGDVIDKERIKEQVLKDSEIYEFVMLAFDPWKAVDLMTDFDKLGLPCGKVGQSAPILGSGNSHWKELILKGPEFIQHDGSPVTNWQMGNIEIYTDGNGNQKILKASGKKENKVDGPVSISNAFVGYLDYKKTIENEQVLSIDDLGAL